MQSLLHYLAKNTPAGGSDATACGRLMICEHGTAGAQNHVARQRVLSTDMGGVSV